MSIGTVYNSPLGRTAIGRVEGNDLYGSQYGYDQIGRVEDGVVYSSATIRKAVGRVEPSGVVYDSPHGYHEVGRVEGDGWIYDAQFRAVGRVEGGHRNEREEVELSGAALRLLLKPRA